MENVHTHRPKKRRRPGRSWRVNRKGEELLQGREKEGGLGREL